MISYSAPAKVILSGEHSVVYGKPALVCAINKRLTVFLSPADGYSCKEKIPLATVLTTIKNYLFKKNIKTPEKRFNLKVSSEIPVGRGLGSSAAISVALASAYLDFYFKKKFDKKFVNDLAYQIEKHFHKNPSGVDNTASCFGGLIYYRKEFEFLKNITILNYKIPKKIEDNLFLIDTGKPIESTSQMVEYVKKMYNKKPDLVEQILNDIEKITKKMVLAIVNEDIGLFQQCILDNEILLELLGVVSAKTKNILRKLSSLGVGKITGAGGKKEGSGYVIFYAKEKLKLIKFLKQKKINYLKFIPDYIGLKSHD